jgi:type 1 glutamine amidotransferase
MSFHNYSRWYFMSRYRPLLLLAVFIIVAPLFTACGGQEVTVDRHAAADSIGKVVFLAGPDSHGPGEHEHSAGLKLLSAALREREPGYETVNVYGGWPEDERVFEGADALVMYCDGGRNHLINEQLASFERLVAQGIGAVALHYCVEAPKGSASAAALLNAIGGYFETDWSVNPHWRANFSGLPVHPITLGIKPFSMQDEWYFNMRFRDSGVTDILSAVAPLSTMERKNGPHSGNDAVRKLVADGVPQVTAWAYKRPNGGRGFGYTGGHFHSNWQDDNARELVLNAIEWTAGR